MYTKSIGKVITDNRETDEPGQQQQSSPKMKKQDDRDKSNDLDYALYFDWEQDEYLKGFDPNDVGEIGNFTDLLDMEVDELNEMDRLQHKKQMFVASSLHILNLPSLKKTSKLYFCFKPSNIYL